MLGSVTDLTERFTYELLSNVKPVNSVINLKVVETTPGETLYFNAAEFIIVDHSPEVIILMDSKGVPHSIKNLIKPDCITKGGFNCTDLIREADAKANLINDSLKAWFGDPKNGGRDYIELTIPETSSEIVKLVISASGTDFFDFMTALLAKKVGGVVQLLGDFGRNLLNSIVAKESVDRATLNILVNKDGKWVKYEDENFLHVWNYKTFVVPINLSKVPYNKLRIEMWTPAFAIDYVGIDDSEDEITNVQIVKPAESVLRDFDDNRLVLKYGDSININFTEPLMTDGAQRTYFVGLAGYYNAYLPDNIALTPDVIGALELAFIYGLDHIIPGYANDYITRLYYESKG